MKFNWRCFFRLHPWAKWGEMRTGKRVTTYNPHTPSLAKTYEGEFTYQLRECPKCGAAQTRILS